MYKSISCLSGDTSLVINNWYFKYNTVTKAQLEAEMWKG